MRLKLVVWGAAMAALGSACGAGEAPAPEVRDVRVAIPEPDARYFDIVTPEVMIRAGGDQAFCLYLDYSFDVDEGARNLVTLQGAGGHHIVVLTSAKPKPNGTLEECTDNASMKDIRPLVIPSELPEGHAVFMGKSGQLVLQFHYVNTTDKQLLVRDVARLEMVRAEDVSTWVGSFATTDALFDVHPGETEHVAFDCSSQEDVDLLLVGGHLHEYGTRFELMVGPDTDHLESIYLVDPWYADFRDAPPVTLLRDNPLHLAKGTIVRTICDWNNPDDVDLQFPDEMCAAFGYVSGTKNAWLCDTSGVLDGSAGFIARYPN